VEKHVLRIKSIDCEIVSSDCDLFILLLLGKD